MPIPTKKTIIEIDVKPLTLYTIHTAMHVMVFVYYNTCSSFTAPYCFPHILSIDVPRKVTCKCWPIVHRNDFDCRMIDDGLIIYKGPEDWALHTTDVEWWSEKRWAIYGPFWNTVSKCCTIATREYTFCITVSVCPHLPFLMHCNREEEDEEAERMLVYPCDAPLITVAPSVPHNALTT